MIDQLFPILEVTDLPRSLAFWRDQMGGRVSFTWPGPDGEPAYAGVDLGTSHLGLGGPAAERPTGPRGVSLWVYTDDCDSLVERLRSAGTPIVEEPADQPWGERVARVLDPDGNLVIIGQRAPDAG